MYFHTMKLHQLRMVPLVAGLGVFVGAVVVGTMWWPPLDARSNLKFCPVHGTLLQTDVVEIENPFYSWRQNATNTPFVNLWYAHPSGTGWKRLAEVSYCRECRETPPPPATTQFYQVLQ